MSNKKNNSRSGRSLPKKRSRSNNMTSSAPVKMTKELEEQGKQFWKIVIVSTLIVLVILFFLFQYIAG